jgi:ADP-ribose pyrophosphatase
MTGEEHPETEVVRHDVLYQGKVVDLYVDTLLMPSGRKAIREVVTHPGGVVVVPVLEDGRLVLLRQFRYPLQTFILEFPAGKLDSNQTPVDTARRELEEESGYRAENMHFELSFHTSPGFCNEIIHLFLASGLTQVEQRLEEGEQISVEIVTVEECMKMIESGEIADAKTILGLLWYRHRLAGSHSEG